MSRDYQHLTDTELVKLLIADDEDAFVQLYLTYKEKLLYFCVSLLKSREQSDDIVQEVFLQLWECRSFLNPELSFSSFIFTIAKNRCLNKLKSTAVEQKAQELLKGQEELFLLEDELATKEYETIFQTIISELPTRRQEIFRLSREKYLTHKEIAEITGISVNTVQDHISKAIEFIKSELTSKYKLPLHLFLVAIFNVFNKY